MQGINHARQSHVPVWLATHCAQAQSSGATCDLSAADSSPFPATQACESRRYGTGLQPVAPAWAIPSYHSTPRAMHTPAHMVTSPSHLHTSPPTRPDSAQVSQHVPHWCLVIVLISASGMFRQPVPHCCLVNVRISVAGLFRQPVLPYCLLLCALLLTCDRHQHLTLTGSTHEWLI